MFCKWWLIQIIVITFKDGFSFTHGNWWPHYMLQSLNESLLYSQGPIAYILCSIHWYLKSYFLAMWFPLIMLIAQLFSVTATLIRILWSNIISNEVIGDRMMLYKYHNAIHVTLETKLLHSAYNSRLCFTLIVPCYKKQPVLYSSMMDTEHNIKCVGELWNPQVPKHVISSRKHLVTYNPRHELIIHWLS